MVEAFLEGARDAGAEVENIQLVEKEIKHCSGCFVCWVKTPGKCVHDDDQAELIKKFLASDIVIYATPLYVDHVTGILKDFLDRTIPILDPHFITDEEGETRHPQRHDKIPDIVVISNCGFPDRSHFQSSFPILMFHNCFDDIFHGEKTPLCPKTGSSGGTRRAQVSQV